MKARTMKSSKYTPVGKFHLSLGNSKIGKVLNTNLQAGDDNLNGRVAQIGSCSGCCSTCKKVCYARKAYRYMTALVAHADNLFLYRLNGVEYENAVVKELKRHRSVRLHRWHSSGEIPDRKYISVMEDVAKRVDDKTHYVYTKRYGWINEEIGDKANAPQNLTVLFSPPFSCDTKEKLEHWSKANNPYGYPVFVYDQGNDPNGIGKMPHCPAVDKNGHSTGIQCADCLRCPMGKSTAVYAH